MQRRFLLRTKQAVELKSGEDFQVLAEGPTRFALLSPDGSLVAIGFEDKVDVLDAHSLSAVCSIECSKVCNAAFSPKSKFLSIWRRATKENDHNLVVYSLAFNKELLRVAHRKQELPQFTEDEKTMCLMQTNTVQAYNVAAMEDTTTKNKIENVRILDVSSFGLSKRVKGPSNLKGGLAYLAIPPKSKGAPARVGLYLLPNDGAPPKSSKSCFRVDEATFEWAPDGRAVLCKTESTHDATGQSYYGESTLHLLRATKDFDALTVELKKQGAVNDFKFSPNSKFFAVVAGKMPTSIDLYSVKTGKAVCSLGEAHRSSVCFSPDGRIIMVGGFGNLTGTMDFYEVTSEDGSSVRKIGCGQAQCAVDFGWTSDSRHFVTASLAPRMKVDNGYEVFDYNGGAPVEVYKSKELLLQCDVVPTTEYEPFEIKTGSMTPAYGDAAVSPPKAYRPPNSTGSLSALLNSGGGGGGHFKASRAASSKTSSVPGMKPVGVPGMKPKSVPGATKKKPSKPKPVVAKQPAATPTSSSNLDADQKKLRKLKKLLKQINALEGNAVSLTDAQKEKIARKPGVLKEIAQLKAAGVEM